jgi:phage terminase large subunit-like protein
MDRALKIELIQLLEEQERRKTGRLKLTSYYPDTGPLRRELYKKHTEFFRAGKEHRERLMLAANRIGKTEGVGGFETTLHLTGLYPPWWEGRVFDRPTDWWGAGDTSKTTRDIIQTKLLGSFADLGSGLIPRDRILKTTLKRTISDAVDTVFVKHISGGVSQIGFKSYNEGRSSFEGTAKDGIWLDEEPPLDIYTECLLRGMTNNGMLILTFTPLMGLSETGMQFLPGGKLTQALEAA